MKQHKIWMEAKARNFTKTENGVQWEAVIFSSEFNRNRAYFDIKKMFKPFQTRTDLLNKVLLNNSHNGKYFSVATDKVVGVVIEESDDGQLTDVYAIIESTNEEKKANPEMVTGFSIEIIVDANDVAVFPDGGEFYRKPEWIGLAYLEGQLAGSGDTRILSMKTFAEAQDETTTNNMQFKLFSQLTKKFMYLDLGDIVLDVASDQPAFIVSISQLLEGSTTVELELFNGDSVTYTILDGASEDAMPVSYLGPSGAIKAIVAMLRTKQVDNSADAEVTTPEVLDETPKEASPEEPTETLEATETEAPTEAPEPTGEGFSKDAEIDQNLAVFKDLEKEDRDNKMKIFKQLKGTEELAEGNQAPATDTVGLSLRERVIDKIKHIQI